MKGYSLIGGVLSIVSGSFGILGLGLSILFTLLIRASINDPGSESNLTTGDYQVMAIMLTSLGAISALIGLLGIIGGICACRRKLWGLALAGASASTITFFPCGVAAIVFVSMGKAEYKSEPRVPPIAAAQV
jgi:hypothetical protein